MTKWNGEIGPAFIVAVGLALIQGLTLYSDSKAAIGERLARVETKMELLYRAARISNYGANDGRQ